jgi:hypothetical protein
VPHTTDAVAGGLVIDNLTAVNPGLFDMARWQWTNLARNILYSNWEHQLEQRVQRQVGSKRKQAWKDVDDSANLLKESSKELACLFDDTPNVSHSDEDAVERMNGEAGVLTEAILWPLMQTVERDARALGNVLLRIDNSSGEFIRYRIVFPDMVVAKADENDPTRPVFIRWARERKLKRGLTWCWDEYDIRNPENPIYRVVTIEMDMKAEEDVSAEVLKTEANPSGDFTGDNYPHVWTEGDRKGEPFLPFVKFDARRSSQLWNWRDNYEIVKGTLQDGVYWTYFGHNLRMGSHRQKYGVNVTIPGSDRQETSDGQVASEVVPDSANILLFKVIDPEAGQPVLGEFDVPVDPEKFIGALSIYERRVINKAAGIKAATGTRKDGTPTSGYTFALSNAEKRGVQKRISPIFGPACVETIEKTAAMHNAVQTDKLPESGWGVAFTGIPLSIEERDAIRRDGQEQRADGLMSPVDQYMSLNPGTTREQATNALERVRQETVLFGGAG